MVSTSPVKSVPVALRSSLPKPKAKPIVLVLSMRLSSPTLMDLRLNSVLLVPVPLLSPMMILALVQVSQRLIL